MSCRMFWPGLLLCVLQSAFAYETERQFIEGLTEAGFPRLAETVLSRTLDTFPEAKAAAPELRIRILIADRQFDEAARQIDHHQATIGHTEPLWLFLAERACTASCKPVAKAAYKKYFDSVASPDAQAAFNYGALLEERGDEAAAIQLYESVEARPVQSRLAALLAKSEPDRALKLAEEVQLGGLDLWFGSSVVTWAQVMIAREEWGEAQSVLETQLELLKPISDAVPSSAAPLAGARYLLGLCYEHDGKPAEALHQFYNAYAKYGDSEWGPKADEKAQALIDRFESQGKTVKIDLGANRGKMEQSAFRVARRLFFDRQYDAAFPAYIEALNNYPEGEGSIPALRELALSAIHLDDRLTAEAVGFYLAERFAAEPDAGDALLAAGKAALDNKKEELAWTLYDHYLDHFPSHPRAPAVLYSLAGLRDREEELFRIVKNYPDSVWAPRARGRLAWNAFKAEDYKTAAERFALYIETETDPQKQTRARFGFAESYRLLTSWRNALEQYRLLEFAMEKAAVGFGVSRETLEFNQPYWEKSVYYQAVCFKELGRMDDAIAACDRFLGKFLQSERTEQVRFTRAKTLIESGRFAEALAALEGLGGKFAEPVCYYRGIAQYETGAYEAGIEALEHLLVTWPASAFTYEAMFALGRAFSAAGHSADAIRVFGDIMSFADDDELMHRASLELGRAQTDPAEKLASFQRVALLADPAQHQTLIAEALFESLPLYLELNRPADLLADADRLTADFPNIANAEQIASLKTKAVLAQQEERPTNHTNRHESE